MGLLEVTGAHLVEPVRHPEAQPFRDNPRICHPDLGWGSVVLINETEFRVRFGDELFAWFKLDDPIVAEWPIQRAASFAAWVRRAA
jgi:hypothetical protein